MTPQLQITNTDKSMLEEVQRVLQCGKIHQRTTRPAFGVYNQKIQWTYALFGRRALPIMHQLREYLRTDYKKKQIDNAFLDWALLESVKAV